MKIGIILGTRPEIIKMSPIIKHCQAEEIDFHVIHTGQHYSYNLDKVFFEELSLPSPNYCLNIGSGSHGAQTGQMLEAIEQVLIKEKYDVVLVQGDTNTALAGSLAASKLLIPLGHVEAGLRSFDRTMPEEINRIISDHISNYLFTPTIESKQNLIAEGIDPRKIFQVGNTVVDALYQNIAVSKDKKNEYLGRSGLSDADYCLVTVHRAENVDNPYRFRKILDSLESVREKYALDIVFPMHPRTRKNVELFDLDLGSIKTYDPFRYLEFLQLMSNANLILTDSGGVQEESCILGVPCVTLRNNTERPETVKVGSNIVAGVEPESVLSCVNIMLNNKHNWKNPYGDGKSSLYIINTLKELVK
jgi:UDP-N-acetylglucosamine 2-epimerase (non-hydrolysing)